MIKIGVKFGPTMSSEYPKEIKDMADYFELYGKTDFDYSFAERYTKPIVVHAPHFFEKVNFCNPKREKINLEAINWAKKTADKFGAEKIIIHPEFKETKECSLGVLTNFIKENFDKRFYIENMPCEAEGNRSYFCSTPEEIKEVVQNTGVNFCLDFAHATEYAAGADLDLEKFLKELLSLSPGHFHISDSNLKNIKNMKLEDEHLTLFKGSIDLNLIKNLLPDNAEVTIETPQIVSEQLKEMEFLRK